MTVPLGIGLGHNRNLALKAMEKAMKAVAAPAAPKVMLKAMKANDMNPGNAEVEGTH